MSDWRKQLQRALLPPDLRAIIDRQDGQPQQGAQVAGGRPDVSCEVLRERERLAHSFLDVKMPVTGADAREGLAVELEPRSIEPGAVPGSYLDTGRQPPAIVVYTVGQNGWALAGGGSANSTATADWSSVISVFQTPVIDYVILSNPGPAGPGANEEYLCVSFNVAPQFGVWGSQAQHSAYGPTNMIMVPPLSTLQFRLPARRYNIYAMLWSIAGTAPGVSSVPGNAQIVCINTGGV